MSLPREKIHLLRVTPRGVFQPKRETRRDPEELPFHTDEPSYNGKSLREWLSVGSGSGPRAGNMYDLLAPDADLEPAEQQGAKQAIQRIGSEAVPFLLELLRRGDRDANMAVAVRGFAALGDLAKSALPDLLFLLEEPDQFTHWYTIWSIGHIGPAAESAIPILLEELQMSRQSTVAADALGTIGPAAAEAVPILLNKLAPGDHPYDIPFIIALGKIGSRDAIQVLSEIAQGTDSRRKPEERGFVSDLRKHRAVEALGNLGQPAVSVLVELLRLEGAGNLSNLYFSERIIRALGSIGPAAREAVPLLRELADRPKQPSVGQLRTARAAAAALIRIEAGNE